uniref:Uncharacterized protein n=1 Tax=Populus alba TaxID=43335 RepID=A0A4U5R163_POPAL|nr:hypothetical protein D5086_0000036040 [Populus alba]
METRVSRSGPAAHRSKTQYDDVASDVAGDVVVDCTDWMTWRVKPDPFCRSRAKKEHGARTARWCAWAVWASARAGMQDVEALWAEVEETRQQVAQIREMLAAGINLNANNRPPVNRTRAEGIARGQPVDRRCNPAPHIQPDSEDDSDEEDDMGYGLPPPARQGEPQDFAETIQNLRLIPETRVATAAKQAC